MRRLVLSVAVSAAAALSACASTPDRLEGAWIAAEASGGVFGQPYPTLVIEGSRISGTASCNRYAGEIQRLAESTRFTDLAVTEMACAPRVMEQETLFLSLMRDMSSLDASQPGLLVLRTVDGRLLRFRSAPPQ